MTDKQPKTVVPKLVKEELEILDRVQAHLKNAGKKDKVVADYDEELIALRDSISEARAEDIPPLIEQMTRLQALAAQRQQLEELPVDPSCPYFGHIRLEEQQGTRDVLLGKRTYLAPDDGVRIVDWRHAPVSRIYYSYDQEDDYEEEFGGRMRSGTVLARRSVTVQNGRLERVAAPEGVYSLGRKGWVDVGPEQSELAGGQGAATRAEQLHSVGGSLGLDRDGAVRKDKHLPEIAALLDRDQFELISHDADDLMIVQGSAGSGKTTVGLHRVAYLAFNDSKRFRPGRMMVMAFNDALVSYISRVLPALGVESVQVKTYKRWALAQRRKNLPGLPKHHSEYTPRVVSRLKKHAAMIHILEDIVDRDDERATEILHQAIAETPDGERAGKAWKQIQQLPLDVRVGRLERWLKGNVPIAKVSSSGLSVRTIAAAESAFKKIRRFSGDVVGSWADLFTDRKLLGEYVSLHAPAEFSDAELDTVHEWCVGLYRGLENSSDDDDQPALDLEDEAILLRLYQLKKGWLRGPGGRLLYDHVMVDEVQDFSPLELMVVLDTVDRRQPVTFAGDTAQKIIRESGFVSWEDLLTELRVEDGRVESLEVAYRSTWEIMKFSREVLGHLAGPEATAKRHGSPVEFYQFTDPGQAVGFLGDALRKLAMREPFANVAVIARHPAQARMYYEGLVKSEVPRLELVLDEEFSFSPGVEVTEVRQAKGLEFDYVVLVDVNADSYPRNDEARHLLHVGATRAAHQLWMLSTTAPSPLLPEQLIKSSRSH